MVIITNLSASPPEWTPVTDVDSYQLYYYSTADSRMGGTLNITYKSIAAVNIASNDDTQLTYSGVSAAYGQTKGLLTIKPTVPLSDQGATSNAMVVTYAVRIPAGLIRDKHGNSFLGLAGDGRMLNAYSYAIDSTPPRVIKFDPATASIAVARTTPVLLTFSESVQAGAGNITLTPAQGATLQIPILDGQVSIGQDAPGVVRITPNASLGIGMLYTTTAPKGLVKDSANNPFPGLFDQGSLSSLHYFTVADTISPAAWGFSPAQVGYATVKSPIGERAPAVPKLPPFRLISCGCPV